MCTSLWHCTIHFKTNLLEIFHDNNDSEWFYAHCTEYSQVIFSSSKSVSKSLSYSRLLVKCSCRFSIFPVNFFHVLFFYEESHIQPMLVTIDVSENRQEPKEPKPTRTQEWLAWIRSEECFLFKFNYLNQCIERVESILRQF